MKLVPGHTYKSHVGTLIFQDEGNLSFVSNSQDTIHIGKLISLINNPKVLEKLLNKNLKSLESYLKENKEELTTYESKTKEEKFHFIINTLKAVQDEGNQWAMSACN